MFEVAGERDGFVVTTALADDLASAKRAARCLVEEDGCDAATVYRAGAQLAGCRREGGALRRWTLEAAS